MFGGTETVASAIEWAMAEMMRSPEDLKKVQQELSNVVGLERRVEESDFEKLTYLKCALKETLRLHPPIPLLLHETAEDAEVSGYYIPKKSRVMINAWAIGRDKNYWDDPETFKPSRFLKEDAPDFKGSNFEFIPFGSGRRSCPGMQLGLYTLELAVAHLCHCFTWELPAGLGQLHNLRTLDLSYNRLTGQIPQSIGSLPELTNVILCHNHLSGSVPVFASRSLTRLDLKHNTLTGSLGPFLGTKHAARVIIPVRRGSIITTASICGRIGGVSSHAYTSSKRAVVGLPAINGTKVGCTFLHWILLSCLELSINYLVAL